MIKTGVKRISVLFIVLLFIFTAVASVLSVGAVPAPHLRGDVNRDGKVNIKDVTHIQKFLANILEYDLLNMAIADYDDNGKVDIRDATLIQKVEVGLEEYDDSEHWVFDYVGCEYFYANYDSKKAMAGVPVTFYAKGGGDPTPISYEFLVNDQVVCEKGTNTEFTYTFPVAGIYMVTVNVYNAFDRIASSHLEYEVVEPYTSELPEICAYNVYRTLDDLVVTTNAQFGTAPYEYKFEISYDGWTKTQEYSHSNTFLIPNEDLDVDCEYLIRISVMDAEGKENSAEYNYVAK